MTHLLYFYFAFCLWSDCCEVFSGTLDGEVQLTVVPAGSGMVLAVLLVGSIVLLVGSTVLWVGSAVLQSRFHLGAF